MSPFLDESSIQKETMLSLTSQGRNHDKTHSRAKQSLSAPRSSTALLPFSPKPEKANRTRLGSQHQHNCKWTTPRAITVIRRSLGEHPGRHSRQSYSVLVRPLSVPAPPILRTIWRLSSRQAVAPCDHALSQRGRAALQWQCPDLGLFRRDRPATGLAVRRGSVRSRMCWGIC